jgi:RimJ/RimL family protein N-acetyltransferase
MKIIMETERIYLREMDGNDYEDLSEILQDKDVMYAYEHSFSDDETKEWLEKQFKRYKEYGFGLWALIDKKTQEFIGQCGLSIQNVNNKEYLEIGYLLKTKYWHNGFAAEAANACKNYAFDKLNAEAVYSIIRVDNMPSQKVAERIGMKIEEEFIKHYYNMEMPHYLYSIKKENN